MKVEAVRLPLPLSEILQLVSMYHVAFCSQLTDVADLRIDGSEEETGVCDVAVRNV